MRKTEIWTTFVNRPYAEFDDVVALAERHDLDGLWVCDSQNIMPEVWVLLTRAAMLSDQLKLGTFVTNPVTRHPAVTAAAASTLQEVAQGRVVLGLGRGDSSLAHLGSGLMKLGPFSHYLDRLQGYLRGEAVPFDPADTDNSQCVSLASLEYAHNPQASQINWLPSAWAKVPVEVAASGRKVMACAAAKADGVILGLGADVDAFRQAIASIHEACHAAGRDPTEITISAVIGIAVHPNRATALELASGSAASTSRWQLMQGAAKGLMSEQDYSALDRTRRAYDMNRHAQGNSSHAAAIEPDLIDRFAVAGPVNHCIARLRELIELGLTRITLPYRLLGVDPVGARVSTELLFREVIPALRS